MYAVMADAAAAERLHLNGCGPRAESVEVLAGV
jgi:hypothetical protein